MSSSIECVYEEFKEKCNIEHALINKFAGPKEFKISIQCIKKKNMDFYKEKLRLYNLCKKHSTHYISCSWDIDFDLKEIISIRPL